MTGHLPGCRFEFLPESLSFFFLNDFDQAKVWLSGMGQVRKLNLCLTLATPPRQFIEFRDHEAASETIFKPKRCFSATKQQTSTCMNIYLSCSLGRTALVLKNGSYSKENLAILSHCWLPSHKFQHAIVSCPACTLLVGTRLHAACHLPTRTLCACWPCMGI